MFVVVAVRFESPLIYPPVMTALPELKFVVYVVVADKLERLLMYPPVTTALPELKFVVFVVVAVKSVRLLILPPEIQTLEELKLGDVRVVILPDVMFTLPNTVVAVLVKLTFLLKFQLSSESAYVIVALAPSTVKPAPLAAAGLAAPFATVIFRSSTSSVATFNVVKSPCTVKLPWIAVLPATFKLPPTPAPPPTTKAPVVDDVDCVVAAATTLPVTVSIPVPLKFAISVVAPYHLNLNESLFSGTLDHIVAASIPMA